MKKWLLSLFAFIILISPSFAQNDQIVNARNVYIPVASKIPWSTLANQTYVLTPQTPDYGFCFSVVNNNPTSSHTVTTAAFQTGDSSAIDYSHNTGRYAALSVVGTNPLIIPASTTGTFFVRSNGAAKIAFNFSGGTTQAGNPDTVDIFAVQTTSPGCGTVNPQTGQQYTLATPNSGTSATTPLQAISDGLSQAYFGASSQTNPAGANNFLVFVNDNTSTKNIYLDKSVISCSAICQVNIVTISDSGTGCVALGPALSGNMKLGATPAFTALAAGSACGVAPTIVSTIANGINIGAGVSITVDLRGLIAPSATTKGIGLVIGPFTGTVQSTIFWYEK